MTSAWRSLRSWLGAVCDPCASSCGEYRCREGRRAGAADERVAVALSAAGRGLWLWLRLLDILLFAKEVLKGARCINAFKFFSICHSITS